MTTSTLGLIAGLLLTTDQIREALPDGSVNCRVLVHAPTSSRRRRSTRVQ